MLWRMYLMKNINTLIIPDVHGRDFWREPVLKTLADTDAHIVFLGDYHDPYPHEFTADLNYDYSKEAARRYDEILQRSVDSFKEIVELKRQYPDRITLLLGNHDLGYVDSNICTCRSDRKRYKEIQKLILDNRGLFQLAYDTTVNGTHFVFSHAGISKKYAEACFGDEANEDTVVELFNDAWNTDNYGVMGSLSWYDSYRGYTVYEYGSCVWADIHEWFEDEIEGYGCMVIGHTQLKHLLVTDKVVATDCHKAVILYNDGKFETYED